MSLVKFIPISLPDVLHRDYLHRHRPTGPNPASVDVGGKRQKRFEKWLENAMSPEKSVEVVLVTEDVQMEL